MEPLPHTGQTLLRPGVFIRIFCHHQPAPGRLCALLLAGSEADWTIKKGALWWFTNRVREGETQTVLRAVIPSDFA